MATNNSSVDFTNNIHGEYYQEWTDSLGRFHREGGPAVVWLNGAEEWWYHGKLHREDGPAYIRPNATREWYKDGELHRIDGPAIILNNGRSFWHIHGHSVDKKIRKWAKVRNIDLDNLTEMDKMIIELEWGNYHE